MGSWLILIISGGIMHLQTVLSDLEKDEGFSGKVYKCPAGYLTVGFGRNLEANPLTLDELKKLFEVQPLSKDAARVLLAIDVNTVVSDLKRVLGSHFDNAHPEAQRVIVNMAFNLGTSGLLKFKKAIEAFKNWEYGKMARELENSLWYKQVGDRSKRLVKILDSIGNRC